MKQCKKIWDFSKLNGRIKEKFGTQAEFTKKLKILSDTSLSYKLNNMVDFKQTEITIISEILDIKTCEIPDYFFNIKVEKTQQN